MQWVLRTQAREMEENIEGKKLQVFVKIYYKQLRVRNILSLLMFRFNGNSSVIPSMLSLAIKFSQTR